MDSTHPVEGFDPEELVVDEFAPAVPADARVAEEALARRLAVS
jgi:hypothetical protein